MTERASGPDDPSSNPAVANAIKALALCRSGAIHDGVELYKRVLKAEYDLRKYVPVVLHLRFLESMGLNDASAAISLDAIMAGQDLCLKATLASHRSKWWLNIENCLPKGSLIRLWWLATLLS